MMTTNPLFSAHCSLAEAASSLPPKKSRAAPVGVGVEGRGDAWRGGVTPFVGKQIETSAFSFLSKQHNHAINIHSYSHD